MNNIRNVHGAWFNLAAALDGSLTLAMGTDTATRVANVAVGALVLILGGLSVGGCASDREVAPPVRNQVGLAAQPISAPLPPGVTPAKVKTALPELEKLTTDLLKKTGVPGLAIAAVHQDQVVYAKGFGVREAGKPDAVDADTVFQLASVSKPLGSTVVAGLVGDHVVKWDDRIIDHDPGFQMHDASVTAALTIRDTYAHRSGLPDHAGDLLEDMGYDRAEILRRLRFVPTENNFRSHYAYTNFGLTEGALAAAKAAGKSWEDLSEDRLYKRLGMTATSSRLSDFLARTNRARGHVLIDGKWMAKYQRKPEAQSPAGGASSSVSDMAQWMRLHLNGGTFDGEPIISAQALAETYRPHMVTEPQPTRTAGERYGFYGLGWNVDYDELGRVMLSHSGAFALGAATAVYLLPVDRLGVVVLTNAQPIGLPEALALSFLDLATYGKVQRDWFAFLQPIFEEMALEGHSPIDYSKAPASRTPPLSNPVYLGTYENAFYGKLEVVGQDGKLVMRQGPKQPAYPLTHYDRDTFYYDTAGENAVGLSGVTFVIGADSKAATGVIVENLNQEGLGRFMRIQGK
jgi:CubicO group peptidase (beta-lactamase class C family)